MQAPGEWAQLARHIQLIPDRWSAAALSRVADGDVDDTRRHAWLRADPAHLRADINGARLLGTGERLGLGAADAAALLPALRPLFGDTGMLLEAPHPARWYLRLARGTSLPPFASPSEALGGDVFEHTPAAADARRWRALLSEAQVVLHNHPHNVARQAAGKPAINALWFWGGGELPDHANASAPTVYSDDPVLRGVGRLGTLACMPLDQFPGFEPPALVDLRGWRDPTTLLERWLLTAATAAARRHVQFDFADGHVVELHSGQRWRFWRRPLTALRE